MTEKTVAQLLEEQNALIREQNKLLAKQNSLAIGISASQHMEEVRARARRNTPWGCKPPTWAR